MGNRIPRNEPLIGTPSPGGTWEVIAMDYCLSQGKWDIIVVDYYSRYFDVHDKSLNPTVVSPYTGQESGTPVFKENKLLNFFRFFFLPLVHTVPYPLRIPPYPSVFGLSYLPFRTNP